MQTVPKDILMNEAHVQRSIPVLCTAGEKLPRHATLATREELLRPGVDVRAFVEAKSYFQAYVPVVTDPGFFDN